MTGWTPQAPGQPRSGPDPLAARGHPYLARSAGIMAEAAGVLGRTEVAGPYAELAKRAAARFRGEYVSPNGGLTFTSQTAHAVALELDLLAPEQRAHAGWLFGAATAGRWICFVTVIDSLRQVVLRRRAADLITQRSYRYRVTAPWC